MGIINETKFTHLKASGTTKSITVPAVAAGARLVVFIAGGAIGTFRLNNSSGTVFDRRNPYGAGAQDASWHDVVASGGETVVHLTLNGAENVAGVIYETTGLSAFVSATANGTGTAVVPETNYQLRPSSSVTVTGKAVLFGGFSYPTATAANSTRRWRQFGPIGELKTFDAYQPGQDTQFCWGAGLADIDQNSSYPENLTTGQYRATSQFISSTGSSGFAAQVAYTNSGENFNDDPENTIVRENSLPGNHRSNWFLGVNGTNSTIAGYTDKPSYAPGDTVNFKVDSTNNPFRVEIYRLGFYGNEQLGARNVLGADTYITGSPAVQSAPSVDSTLGSTSCAWSTTASWTIPSTMAPGSYYVLFRRTDNTAHVSTCHFTVKTSPTNKIVMITPDNTYQAYNVWGATTDNGSISSGTWTGRSLYQSGADGASANFAHRAYAVNRNRPYSIQATRPNTYMFDSEYGMLVFMEAQGYDMTYASDVDLENDEYLNNAKLALCNGHSEYWSTNMWNCYQNARDAGVNIMFNSGNIALWRVRFAIADTDKRTMICYKDSQTVDVSAGFTGTGRDPLEYTGTWRDSRTSNPNNTDRRPEDAITGQWFKVNAPINDTLDVPFAQKSLPIWRNSTSIQALTTGQTYTTPVGVVGDEVDYVDPSSTSKPSNIVILSPSIRNYVGRAANANGTVYTGNTGDITLGFSLYRADSGALVFHAGSWRGWLTVSRWQKGDYQTGATPDINWQNALLAILYDLDVDLVTPTSVVPADTQLADPATSAPGPTRDDVAIAYGLEVPVESSGEGNFIGFFFGN